MVRQTTGSSCTYPLPLPSATTVAIAVTVLTPPGFAGVAICVSGPVFVAVGNAPTGVELGLLSSMQDEVPWPTVMRSLDPPMPVFPPSNAPRINEVPAATLVFHVQVVVPGLAAYMNGWPEGMTPISRTGATAVLSHETSSREHCCGLSVLRLIARCIS
jgi:hypothetical protein